MEIPLNETLSGEIDGALVRALQSLRDVILRENGRHLSD